MWHIVQILVVSAGLSGWACAGDRVSRESTFGVTVPGDANTREVTFDWGEALMDAVSREWTFARGGSDQDAVAREVTMNLGLDARDVITRETSFWLEDPNGTRNAVTREVTAYILHTLDLNDQFIGTELVAIPRSPIRWMSLAVPPLSGGYPWDVYAGVATTLNGTTTDPPNDYIYRALRTGKLEEFLAFPAADTDPVSLAFGPGRLGGSAASRLFVTANGYDGGVAGEVGGAILAVDPNATVSVIEPTGPHLAEPRGLATVPSSAAGFPSLLYYAHAGGNLAAGTVQPTGGAANWSLDATTLGRQSCVRFAPGNAFGDGLYLGGEDGIVYRSNAAGEVTAVTAALGAEIQALAFSSGYGFGEWLYVLLADGRVLRVDPAGATEPFLTGVAVSTNPAAPVRNDMCFTLGGDLMYLTDAFRRVIYQVRFQLPTGVPDGDSQVPAATLLDRVYPNPFNPGTHVRFALAHAGPVRLNVYDIRGQLVRQLLEGVPMPAGTHEVFWDGRDAGGRGVASGVYVVKLDADQSSFARKVTLMK